MDKKAKAILTGVPKGTFVPKVCDKFQRKVYQEFDKLVDSGIANEKEIVSYLGKLDLIEKDRKDPKAVKIYLEWIKEGAKHKEEGLERKGKLWNFLTCYESFKVKDAGVEETLKKKSEGGKRRKRTKRTYKKRRKRNLKKRTRRRRHRKRRRRR